MKSNRKRKLSLWTIIIILSIGILNTLIFNEKPLVGWQDSVKSYPAITEWMYDMGLVQKSVLRSPQSESVSTMVKYSYDFIPSQNESLLPPLSEGMNGTHWLGTDNLGRDVLAGLARGAFIVAKVGLLSLCFSAIIGLFFGIMSGYFANNRIKINFIQALCAVVTIFLLIFYNLYPMPSFPRWMINLSLIFTGVFTISLSSRFSLRKWSLPVDTLVLKMIEILKSIPTLVILLALSPLFIGAGSGVLIVTLSLILWVSFARHSRAEIMSVKQKDFVAAAKSLGLTDWQIIKRHVLPAIAPTILTLSSFVLASIILLESSLAFLGIGQTATEVSWGSMIAQGRLNTGAWWLTLFPGLMIFIMILCLNVIIDSFQHED